MCRYIGTCNLYIGLTSKKWKRMRVPMYGVMFLTVKALIGSHFNVSVTSERLFHSPVTSCPNLSFHKLRYVRLQEAFFALNRLRRCLEGLTVSYPESPISLDSKARQYWSWKTPLATWSITKCLRVANFLALRTPQSTYVISLSFSSRMILTS